MNVTIHNRHLEITQSLQHLIDRQVRKLGKILPTFSTEDLDLHVSLEHLPRGKQFQAALVLNMPQTAFRVETIEDNSNSSVLRAFEELFRKIVKFKSRLSRERFWQEQPELGDGEAGTRVVHELENAINRNLEQVETYIRRELYHQSLVESIPLGLVEAQAVVDEVFLEVSTSVAARPENLPVDRWMFQVARSIVQERIRSWQTASREPHIEELAPDVSQWEDELLDFYQPDEVLRLEDLLSDSHSTNPEELLERQETQEQLQEAIARLPSPIRESFVLHALEGFNSEETAMITDRSPSEVVEDIRKARVELHRLMGGRKRSEKAL